MCITAKGISAEALKRMKYSKEREINAKRAVVGPISVVCNCYLYFVHTSQQAIAEILRPNSETCLCPARHWQALGLALPADRDPTQLQKVIF